MLMTTLDTDRAILMGEFANAAYEIEPDDLTDAAGATILGDYTVVSSIYANDLATTANPDAGDATVSIGLVCQNAAGDTVVVIRGTEGILEWMHDTVFDQVPFMVDGMEATSIGFTDDGFTGMYKSLRLGPQSDAPKVVAGFNDLTFPQSVASLTLTGHSLGGALITMLAIDLTITNRMTPPTVYTFGSPRVGDATFVSVYNRFITDSWRIANRIDIVPTLPISPYEHVNNLYELNPVRADPFEVLVQMGILCEHHPETYLFLLSNGAIPLRPECQP